MKNDTNQEIRIGGWETKSTPDDLVQIKNFLQTIKQELLNITIVSHSKKKNTYQQANYRPKNQTLFVDPQILEEIKKYRIEIIKNRSPENDNNIITLTNPTTPLKSQNNTLKTHFPIFQINYHNKQKDYIKELIGKIDVNKLETLQLYQLDPQKLDKYNNPINTNYKKGLNIIYYREEDLKYIKLFLIKSKQGYRVKKMRPDYKRYLTKEKS
ncbi:hypothetical protein [Candidatus Phytoplasma solani]|uniref:Phase variable surface lipoprotein n=1 Tax=Candidatus Phytoplasma solani TaxID=69896 RepID=A0A421NUC1_9MOLU|nr:hypothetical protein [Candidatus Phytoplasma solani]RMI87623.1 hypothetical protein PSSA1_v1c6800 [Candidatus Phytoplasma solani]